MPDNPNANNVEDPREAQRIQAQTKFVAELSAKYKEVRQAGVTPERLSEITGINKAVLAYFGEKTPTLETIFKLLTPLGYKIDIIHSPEEEEEKEKKNPD
jgi:hypothetical protein